MEDLVSLQSMDYSRWDAQARIGLDTPLAEDNVGYRLLKKMGWKDNTGLGRDGNGIKEPVPIQFGKIDYLGVGKAEEDEQYCENIKRKALEAEVVLTDEQQKVVQVKGLGSF